MLPTSRLLYIVGLLLVLAIFASFYAGFTMPWLLSCGVVGLLVIVDLVGSRVSAIPEIERHLPGRFAAGVEQQVELTIHNKSKKRISLQLFDGIPAIAETNDLPWVGNVEAGRWSKISYGLSLGDRGTTEFDEIHLLIKSPLGLFERRVKQKLREEVRVYPNYEPVIQYALLAMQHRQDQMGVVKKHRIGMSREFHQLRDYHQGDGLAQIDWKSTARHRRLISRDYQEQRNQTILLAVDSGRRLRAMDGDTTQFDHALNAMLFVAYLALRQGDQVGIMSFGQNPRYLAPVKGANGMSVILNHLYDYETSLNPTDFLEAAEEILIHQRRRALVVMLTNLRGEDGASLIEPVRRLRQKHLVLLASLREKSIDSLKDEEIHTLDDALRYGASRLYLNERDLTLRNLNSHGILTLDVPARELAVSLANQYYDIKAMGAL